MQYLVPPAAVCGCDVLPSAALCGCDVLQLDTDTPLAPSSVPCNSRAELAAATAAAILLTWACIVSKVSSDEDGEREIRRGGAVWR